MGSLQWHLVLSNFIAWFLVGLALIKGVKSLGKVKLNHGTKADGSYSTCP